jgi:hypothetical protein
MQDRRCKLGLAGRLELVRLVEQGYSLRAAAAAVGVGHAMTDTDRRNTGVRSGKRLLISRTALNMPWCLIHSRPTG